MSLINCHFLKLQSIRTLVEKMTTLIKIKGINAVIHKLNKYTLLDIYLLRDLVIAYIYQEFHLIKNLKANILIKINILRGEGIDILLMEKTAII